jgi:hypothetical protein
VAPYGCSNGLSSCLPRALAFGRHAQSAIHRQRHRRKAASYQELGEGARTLSTAPELVSLPACALRLPLPARFSRVIVHSVTARVADHWPYCAGCEFEERAAGFE